MVAYKVRKLDGTWYTLGSGSQAKIRALDGSWYVEGNTGPPDAKVRLLAGTMGPGVPFGTDGDTIYSTATYSRTAATVPSVCVLQGVAGADPTAEFHTSFGSSRAASYRLRNDGTTERQDFIAFFSEVEVYPTHTLEGAPTPPSGFTVQWCDAEGVARSEGRVDVMSIDVTVQVVTGAGGLSPVAGSNVIIRQTPFQRLLGTPDLSGAVVPTTAHATNGPTGPNMFTIPTSTAIGTGFTATISRSAAGSIGLHCGVDWAITATTFDLGGESSVNVGRWLDIDGTALTYKRYYKFVPIA